jgi:isocitrate dehydrogenase kinase/phosphatase
MRCAVGPMSAVRDMFMRRHADLLDASFWQAHKDRILAGHVFDVFPYDKEKRFGVLAK